MVIRRIADRLLVAGFVLALATYSWMSWSNVVEKDGLQLATVTAARTWKSLDAVPAKLEALFTNNLPARETLTALYAVAKMSWCGVSPTPRVWVGADGWMFYNHNADDLFMPANDPDRDLYLEYWAHEFSARHLLLEEIGCKYLLVIAPNKQTIYPEYMPGSGRRVSDTVDRFLKCERLLPGVRVLDLREPLLAAKGDKPLYLYTDTHWNADGAYIGYAAIVEALAEWFPEMQPRAKHKFYRLMDTTNLGDLARMVGLDKRITEDMVYLNCGSLPRMVDAPVPMDGPMMDHVKSFIFEQDGTQLPKGVMLCDSFAEHITPWLSWHFSRFVSVGTYGYERKLIAAEKPQVVIQLLVERELELKLKREQLIAHALIRR